MWLTLNGGRSWCPQVVQVHGEVDLANAARLRDLLTEILHRHTPHLVVDLSDINFCDSSGLAALVGAARRAELLDGELLFASPTPQLGKILRLTGLDTVFRVYPTVATALAVSSEPASSEPAVSRDIAVSRDRAPALRHEPADESG